MWARKLLISLKSLWRAKPFEKCYTDVTEFALPNCAENSIFLLFWMAIIAKLLILPYPALQTSYKSRPCLRRSFLRKLTQIPFSIVTKVGNTNMKSITVFLQVKAYVLPCLAREPAQIMAWWSPSLASWKQKCFTDLRKFQVSGSTGASYYWVYFYYNNKRIKTKLKGLSPVQYRTKSFQ